MPGRRKWQLKHTSRIALVAAFIAAPFASQAEPLTPARKSELVNLIQQDCGSCHGMTLKGGLGKPLLPENLNELASEDLVDKILDGVPGTPMPPWRGLISTNEAIWIAETLKRGLKK